VNDGMRTLITYLNSRRVGVLSEGNDLWRFEYDAEWLNSSASFDLAPGLQRASGLVVDGGSNRPVQWYFDNLLPEETLRETISKEAGLKGEDAFALLQYLGAESTGSLVLLPPDEAPVQGAGLQPLSDLELSRRIRDLPRLSLNSGAPKRMSVAGAQHKLLVVYRDNDLFEPVGSEPSTHILKPDHLSADYPASVFNEFLTMRLADAVGLQVPSVHRRYVPEPVYLVKRFDRFSDGTGKTQRKHVIDACQLLNKSRTFKNTSANLKTLKECVEKCRNRAGARLGLFRWLIFNLMVANDDNHLKNISFVVSSQGVDLAPSYDLLSTGTYHTRAFADHRATWPNVQMMIPLPGSTTFGDVSRSSVLAAAEVLGLTKTIGERELDKMAESIPKALANLSVQIQAENKSLPESARVYLGGEIRLLNTLKHLVLPEMLKRMGA
jgi:serine/threonine-protein kinase HipA